MFAVACGARTADPSAGGPPVASAPPTEAAEALAVDLSPGGAAVSLDNGWTVQHCEGDAPFLCVRDSARTVLGTVEYASYPIDDDLAAAVGEGRVLEALEAQATDRHEWVARDRAAGCGEGYEYRGAPVTRTTVGGQPGVRFAFTGVVDGREVERHRSYSTFHAGQLWILSAPASDPAGCMATDLAEFAPADLATFEPYLDRVVAGSELPAAGRAITDGADARG